ncbi:hypothetical protein EI42_03021 [Thermosporothrix hazakensis]|jgi:hypothetical protein|uniref:Uncharacterized protein n=1 Tax=Thermosporothrix hazakensis TaxID=644383 RepID=A0A326U7N1_THEHA|nr:hypothetical protein EI42_03021 [Thermosporothrix hazakensis]
MALKGRQRGLYGANKGVNAATFQIKRIRALDFSSKAFVLFWSLGCTIPASPVLCCARPVPSEESGFHAGCFGIYCYSVEIIPLIV